MSADAHGTTALTPLLILGSPRSGTTFLAHMVNRFFDMRVSRDNGTLVRFHGLMSHYEPLTDDHNLKRLISNLYADHYIRERLIGRGLVLSQQELFERVKDRTYGGLIDTIFSAIAAQRGRSTWGYKRASLASMTGDSITDLFPRARIVHIIRDAREVVLSMHRANGALLERSWHFGAADWVSHVSKGRDVAGRIGGERYHEISYERFMKEPADVMIEILDFCGGGSDRDARAERIRAEIGGLVKHENTEKWRTQVPADALRKVERVAGPLLRDLGYPLMFPEIAGQPVGGLELAYLHTQRAVLTVLGSPFNTLMRYQFEGFKARQRARFGQADGDADD
jgi:hypothetical protein